MNKKEKFDLIQPMLKSFDVQVAALKVAYGFTGEDGEYFDFFTDYTKYQGIVTIYIKNNESLPIGFIEELEAIFTKTFPFPYGMGN